MLSFPPESPVLKGWKPQRAPFDFAQGRLRFTKEGLGSFMNPSVLRG